MAKNDGNNVNGNIQLPCTKSLKHRLAVTLQELYTGATRQLHVKRSVACGDCQGPRSNDPLNILPENHCHQCRGTKTVNADLDLECLVRPGMRIGQKITYENESVQEPDHVVVLTESYEKHKVFERRGDDLMMTMSLDLVESLCGFKRIITTLDKRQLRIISPPGKVIQHKDIKYVPGEGMPKHETPNERGRLIIQFKVIMPDTIDSKFLKRIGECLPSREKIEIPKNAEDRPMTQMPEDGEDIPQYVYYDVADEQLPDGVLNDLYLIDVEAGQQNEDQQRYFDNNGEHEQMEHDHCDDDNDDDDEFNDYKWDADE